MIRLTKFLWASLLVAALAVGLAAPSANLAAERAPNTATLLAQADVDTLAALMPNNASVFVGFRTDDGYIQALDGVLQKILAKLPQGVAPSISLMQLLDQATQPLGGDFQSTVRAWLGDNGAFAIGSLDKLLDTDRSNDSETEFLLVLQITDRAAAEALFERLAPPSGYTKNSTADFTDYEDANGLPVAVRVTNDLFMLGNTATISATLSRDAKLNSNPDFTTTAGALPAEGYNILAYLNFASLQSTFEMMMPPAQRELLAASFVPIAFGATILDERSLVLDTAVPNTVEALYGDVDLTSPTNPTFAAYMPADTILSIQTRNLKGLYDVVLTALRSSMESQGLGVEDLERGLRQIEGAVQMLTGLDLNEDILSWMTGDFALFVAYTPQANSLLEAAIDPDTPVPFVGYNFGLIIEATDAAKAANIVSSLGTALERALQDAPNVTLTKGDGALTIALDVPNLSTPIELVLGANDSVFYFATKAAADHITSGTAGLTAALGYEEAMKYALPNANQIWYMGTDTINLAAEFIALQDVITGRTFSRIIGDLSGTPQAPATPDPRQELSQFRQTRFFGQLFAPLLSSSSISVALNGDYQVSRLVLTLPE